MPTPRTVEGIATILITGVCPQKLARRTAAATANVFDFRWKQFSLTEDPRAYGLEMFGKWAAYSRSVFLCYLYTGNYG